jgi:lysophospholipid hydrolase
MKEKCGGEVIAVDVGSELRLTTDFDEFPSPWKIATSTVVPFQKPIRSPNIFHLLLAATYVGSVNKADQLKKHADYYLRPPVEKFSLMDLDKIDEIAEVGYEYSKEQIKDWFQINRLGRLFSR